MRGHNVCFYKAIRKIIPKLSLLRLLIWTADYYFFLFDRGYSHTCQQMQKAEEAILHQYSAVDTMEGHYKNTQTSIYPFTMAHAL